MRLVELARVPPLPATSSWRCDSIYEMESLAFLQNASLVIHSSRAVVSSPRSSSVQSFHVSPQRIAPTMRDAKTKLPYDSRFSRPNRQTRPQWEPPAIEQPVPSVVEDPLPSIDAGESGSSAESMSLSNDNLVESNEIVQGEDIISNDNRGIGGNDVGGNDIVQADGMTPIDDGDIARNGVGRNENVQEDDSTPLDDEAIANNDVESNEIVQADDMSVNDDGGTSRNDAERKESVHTDDMSLSSGGAVAGSGVEVNEIVQEEDMVLIDDGGNSDDGDEGNGSDDGNGGNDDNGESDGEDDERNELTRILRLTEEEGKRATMEQLRSIEAASRIPVIGSLALSWPALRDRLAANRRLPLQMGVEITVGVVTKTIAELNGRGDRFWKEFDFYLSDMALEIFGDAILVWLLSPAALLRGSGVGVLGRLPKHFTQIGAFSFSSRVAGFGYKALQFGTAGFCSSTVGHGLTRFLVKQRQKGAEATESEVELAPIIPTSLAWGGFMMASSNTRYQMVNGIEQRLLDPLLGGNAPLLTAVTFALRFGNCYVGGWHWLPWAKMWNIQ